MVATGGRSASRLLASRRRRGLPADRQIAVELDETDQMETPSGYFRRQTSEKRAGHLSAKTHAVLKYGCGSPLSPLGITSRTAPLHCRMTSCPWPLPPDSPGHLLCAD